MATLKNLTINDTGFLKLPSGTIAQRPASPNTGMMRYNSDIGTSEIYNGSLWIDPATNRGAEGSIVTSSLRLHYDFGDRNSYYNSRNIVYDLSGNGTHSRVGSLTVNLLDNPTQTITGGEFHQYYDLRPIFETYGLVPYSLSFDMRTNTAGDVLWYMQNGSYTKYAFVGNWIGSTTSYVRYKIENVTPSGPNSTWLQNSPGDNRAMLATYTVYGTGRLPTVTNFQLEVGKFCTPFVNGSRINNLAWSGNNGGYITFDGTDDYINVGSLDLRQNFTLEVWTRMSNDGSYGIFGQGPTAVNQGIHILYQSGSRGMIFGMYGNDNDYGNNYRPSTGTWYHWVFTYNHSTFAKQFYANGVLQTPAASVQNQYTGTGDFFIGSIYSVPIYALATGDMAIVRMYTKVLTQAEVTQNFNAQRSRFGV